MPKFLILLASATWCMNAQSEPSLSAQGVEHVLDVVRSHVRRLETSVPTFVCKEEIVSDLFQKEKLRKETKAEAVLTTTRRSEEGRGVFQETRAEMKINGKSTRRNEISGPFVWKGGPAYGDLHYLFNSDHGSECRTYRLVGPVKLNGKSALFVQAHAAQSPGQQQACPDLPADSADRIWLDPVSLNVMRIESFNPPTTPIPGAVLTLTVDYRPVTFDSDEYWLPKHFISRLDFPGTPKHLQYEAFFSEYHKFTAQSTIHIDEAQ